MTKPGLRSVWALNEKSGFATELEGLENSFDSHEVPALDPIRLSQGELPADFTHEEPEEGSIVET